MKRLIIFLVLWPIISYGTILEKGPITIEGYIKNETGWNMNENKFMKILNVIDLRGQFRPNDYLSFYAHINKFWDSAYGRVGEYRAAKDDMYTNEAWHGLSWVREMYVDFFSDYVDIRAGKQIVTWGAADGIRILDQVNPLDYREFTLKDWNEIKIPLWMLKVEVAPTVNGSLQFLFIPDFEPNYLATDNAPFAYTLTRNAYNAYKRLRNFGYHVVIKKEMPAETFENAKFGIRWRDVINSFEYTLNYLYGWNMSAETYSSIDMTTATGPSPLPGYPPIGSTYYFVKKYSRIHLWGFSFSKTLVSGLLQGLTIRGEFAYFKDVPMAYRLQSKTYYHKVDQYKYVIGLDKYIVTNWLFSFQFIQLINSKGSCQGQKFILPSGGTMDKVSTYLTLKIATDFFHERVKPDILILYGDDNEWRISPKVYIEIGDHVTTTIGMHIFEGDAEELYGEFDDKDEIYFQLKYSF